MITKLAKHKIAKKLFSTSSLITIFTSAINVAIAAPQDTVSLRYTRGQGDGASKFSNMSHWAKGGGTGAPTNNPASMIFFGENKNIEFDKALGNIGSINAYGWQQTITVSKDNQIVNVLNDTSAPMQARVAAADDGSGRIGSAGININAKIDFSINDAVVEFGSYDALTDTNNGYLSALGNITLEGDNSKIIFSVAEDTIITGEINGTDPERGSIQVNTTNLRFDGPIGNTEALKSLTINDNKSIIIGDNLSLTENLIIGQNASATANFLNLTIKANDITGSDAGHGNLTLSQDAQIESTIGSNKALESVYIENAHIKLQGNKLKANTIKFTDNGTLEFLKANTQVSSDITTDNNQLGKIIISADQKFTTNLGTNAGALGETEFNGNKTLELEGDGLIFSTTKVTTDNDLEGNLIFKGDGQLIKDTIIGENKPLGQITIGGAGKDTTVTFDRGGVNAEKLIIDDANINNIIFKNYSTINTAIILGHDDSKIEILQDDPSISTTINSTIDGNINGKGSIVVGNNVADLAFTKKIGNNNAVTSLTIGDESNVTMHENAKFKNPGSDIITLGKRSTLTIVNNTILTGENGDESISGDEDSQIEFINGDHQLTNIEIGKNNPVSSVNIQNASLKVNKNITANSIVFGSENDTLETDLSTSDITVKSDLINNNNEGILKLTGNNELNINHSLGEENNRLKTIIFNGDSKLQLTDGSNIYLSEEGVQNDTDGNGSIIFAGNSVVDSIIGSNNKLKTLQSNGLNSTVTFYKDVNVSENISLKGDSILEFAGNIIATDIYNSDHAGKGTIKFINNDEINVSSSIGDNNSINELIISNNDVTILNNLNTNIVSFTNNAQQNRLTIIGNSNIAKITSSGDAIDTVAIMNDIRSSITEVGSNTHALKSIELLNDNKAIIDSQNFYSSITTQTDNTGKVEFAANDAFVYSIGKKNSALAEVKFIENGLILGDLYAYKSIIEDNKTAKIGGINKSHIESKEILLSKDSSIIITHNSILDAPITSSAPNINNSVIFEGDVIINSDIGQSNNKVGLVDFSPTPGTKANLNNNIYANNIKAENAELIIDNSLTIQGDLKGQNTVIDLKSNTLNYSGNAIFTDNISIISELDLINDKIGAITLQDVDTNFDGSSANINITFKADSDIEKVAGKSYQLFSVKNPGQILANNLTVNIDEKQHVVRWEYDPATYSFSACDSSKIELQNIVTDAQQAITEVINNTDFTHEAEEISLPQQQPAPNVKNITSTSFVAHTITNTINSTLHRRLNEILTMIDYNLDEVDEDNIGVASGDIATKMGFWASALYDQATQKTNHSSPGFKSKLISSTIGFDTMVNDTTTIGAAISILNTKLKLQGEKQGDKSDIDTYIISLYGQKNFNDAWFIEGDISLGNNHIKNKTQHIITEDANKQSITKYQSYFYGTEAFIGYNIKPVQNLRITPIAGMRYTYFNDNSYNEYDAQYRNLKISKSSFNKLDLVCGLKAELSKSIGKTTVTPGIHALANHTLNAKSPTVHIMLDGASKALPSKISKPSKTFFDIGTDISIKNGRMEYTLAYESHLAKKYVGHQGSMKVRINL